MRGPGPGVLAALLVAVLAAHVIVVPSTKVEESFTLQAVHDIWTLGVGPEALSQYDHVTFPGAVPRSFVGPLVLAIVTWPAAALSYVTGDSVLAQTGLRIGLAACTAGALVMWAYAVFPVQRTPRWLLVLLSACQFHLPFWAGRTTPNGVALPLVLIALALVVRGRRMYVGLALLAATATVLRLELLGLAIPCYLAAWLGVGRPLVHLVPLGLAACAVGVALSTCVDSYFWQRPWLWPEGDAVLFNVVEGHSAEWGVAPWHMYLTQALPRLLAAALPMAALGAASFRDRSTALLVWMAGVHVALLSVLPHKEWRFILYTIPLWNALAARGLHRCLAYRGGTLVVAGVLAISVAQCVLSLAASALNYPGGAALALLHERARGTVHVHIDTLSATTGVSLLQSTHLARPHTSWVPSQAPDWVYNKTESPTLDLCPFTHMLTERACPPAFRDMAAPVQALARIQLLRPADYLRALRTAGQRTWLPVRLVTADAIHGIGGRPARLRRKRMLHEFALVRLNGQDPVLDRVFDKEAMHGDCARLPKAVDSVDRLFLAA
ncbi:dolichyl-P-Man:Man7GlcNAc2-PP-dolichol alpha-1,6-mannosyltransferase [Malassezia caprae]|uniref:Mannosyltransferase n=1 Tax=Malassezia caprae TaxID=1381934 RepID=A0AAF0E757_9BASI|nr:dolichyl-P-Man:Man7GlcNAc2-PP-dolichol alpha-1,6-mannosyltransferase [Malassezia caprae]